MLRLKNVSVPCMERPQQGTSINVQIQVTARGLLRVRVRGNQAIGLPLQRPLLGHTFSFRPKTQFSLKLKTTYMGTQNHRTQEPKMESQPEFLMSQLSHRHLPAA